MHTNIAERIYNHFVKLVDRIVALMVGLMVIAVSCNVIARYCLKIGLIWAEEFSMLLFVWVVFLGAYVALRNKAHLALTFIICRLPPKLRNAQRILVLVLTIFFLAVIAWGGMELVASVIELGQKTALLRISSAWSIASAPTSAILMLIEVIMVFVRKDNIIRIDDYTKEGSD